MIKKLLFEIIFMLLLFSFVISPAAGTTYFNPDGARIDHSEFEKAVNARQVIVKEISRNGYGNNPAGFEDPVRLRKRRIEQWKKWRQSNR